MKKESLLDHGKIPPRTVCPFRAECNQAKNGHCYHKSTQHEVPYSCGYARLLDILKKD